MIKTIALTASAVVGTLVWSTRPAPSEVEFNLVAADDSGSYYMYRFELVNPSNSSGGLTSAAMDVSASSGTPATMATTGGFLDFSGSAPFAEVGPDAPDGWEAMLTSNAKLRWSLPTLFDSTPDSVSPGDTVAFAIRSSYLPGLRTMFYGPTVESCCLTPTDTTEDHFVGSPSQYEVEGSPAVGPRYMSTEVDVDLLRSQLDTVCGVHLWIDDAALCAQLSDSLDAVADRLAVSDIDGGRRAVSGAKLIVDRNTAPLGVIELAAGLMLKTNLDQLLSNIGPPSPLQPSSVSGPLR